VLVFQYNINWTTRVSVNMGLDLRTCYWTLAEHCF